jgi:hypothetical protein
VQTESTFPSEAVTSLRVLHGAQCDSRFSSPGVLGPAAGGRDVWEGVSLSTSSYIRRNTLGENDVFSRTRPPGRISL